MGEQTKQKIDTLLPERLKEGHDSLMLTDISDPVTATRPKIPVCVNGKYTTEVILDSGASANFISLQVLKDFDLLNMLDPGLPLEVSAVGHILKTEGSIKLNLCLSLSIELNVSISFYVIDIPTRDTFLGLPFIRKYQQYIDWNKIGVPNVSESESTDVPVLNYLQFQKEIRSKDSDFRMLYIQTLTTENTSISPEEEIKGLDSYREQILNEFSDVVSDELPTDLPPSRSLVHRIILQEPNKIAYRRQYKLSHAELEELTRQVSQLMRQGFIRPSASPFNSPVLFVKKKDGSLRLCIDYRALNENTIKDKFPIPDIERLTTDLGTANVYSKLDLMSGYYQVRIAEQDIEKTAFSTDSGHFEWIVMPFGLTNAPSTFQRMMNNVLQPYISKFVKVYIDDILIYSQSVEEHFGHVKKVLELLRQNHLIAKKRKCEFFFSQLKFLGFIISPDGIKTDPEKIEVVKNWPMPQSKKDVQSFLGLTGFYRRFIKDYSKIAVPLHNYVAGNETWYDKQIQAFEKLKQALITAPLLVHPIWDRDYTFRIHTDACGTALGYVLEQLDPEGKVRGVIAYGSKKLLPAQMRYSIYEREFLAIVEALKTWRYYLMDKKFIIQTDHRSLKYVKYQNSMSQMRVAKWLDFLTRFDFEIEYIKGKTNTAADSLSRYPNLSLLKPMDDSEVTLASIAYFDLSAVLKKAAVDQQLATLVLNRWNSALKKNIIAGYSADTKFAEVYNTLKDHKTPSPLIRNYIKHFLYRNKLLYFSPSVNGEHRLVIPNDKIIRDRLMRQCHDSPSAGHFSYWKTYLSLSDMFYWPNMLRQVKKFCGACNVCARSKTTTQKPFGLFHPLPVPNGRWTDVSMDFVTGLPRTHENHNMIMVIIDRFSKMAHFIPTDDNLDAERCAQLFVRESYRLHGFPTTLVSDKDIRFVNRFWHTFTKLVGTNTLMSTTNHPQTDGQTERVNQILDTLIRELARNALNDWDKILPMAEFAYNSAIQNSTGYSPFYVAQGYNPDSPAHISADIIDSNRYSPRAEDFVRRLELIGRQVKDNIVQSQHSQEAQYNRHVRDHTFKVGDYVLVNRNAFGIKRRYQKILPVYYGPFKIVRPKGPNTFEIDIQIQPYQNRTMNVRWFKPYLKQDAIYPKEPPHTDLEVRDRLCEIIGIAGIN